MENNYKYPKDFGRNTAEKIEEARDLVKSLIEHTEKHLHKQDLMDLKAVWTDLEWVRLRVEKDYGYGVVKKDNTPQIETLKGVDRAWRKIMGMGW